MKNNVRLFFALKCLLAIISCFYFIGVAAAYDEADDLERVSQLEKSMTKLYLYPVNRLLDLHDVIHFGIAGCLGLGAEVAITEKASFGGYYTAKEIGIAYHGHRKRVYWLDFPSWADYPLSPASPVKLIPGVDSKQKIHLVEHGYATASFGSMRKETSDDPRKHFKRYSKKAVVNELMISEHQDSDQKEPFMECVDKGLNKENEAAIRAEVVAGLIHPYVAIELYELLDFAGGIFFLDFKNDDWNPHPGHGKLRKLGRGMSNIITGALEVPLNIIEINKIDGGVAALTFGTTRGIWRFMVRSFFVGPWEVITFPVATEAIIEPEFPFATSSSEFTWRVRMK